MGEGRGGSNGNMIGLVLLILVVGVVGVFAWFYEFQRPETVELNPDDLCPRKTTRGIPAVYVVLIDQTDPLDELARKSIGNTVITRMQSDLEQSADAATFQYARMEVWTFGGLQGDVFKVGDVQLSLTRVLSMCNPGTPAKWDHLYKNAELVKRQHAKFYASVRTVLETSLAFKEAPRSPVIEAFYGIGAKVFSDPAVKDSRKKLLVVSDLMQNTTALSFLSTGAPKFEMWRNTTLGRQTMPNLSGVSLKAFVIPGTASRLQNSAFAMFWTDLFSFAGVPDGGDLQKIQ